MSIAKHRQNRAHGNSRKLIISSGVILCLFIGVVMLYPAARDYYIAFSLNEQLRHELVAVEERNDQIRAQIAHLNTREGITDRARERFGWAFPGEHTVNITGLEVTSSPTQLPAAVPAGSGAASKIWWTQFLDILFVIEEKAPPEPIPDPFIP